MCFLQALWRRIDLWLLHARRSRRDRLGLEQDQLASQQQFRSGL